MASKGIEKRAFHFVIDYGRVAFHWTKGSGLILESLNLYRRVRFKLGFHFHVVFSCQFEVKSAGVGIKAEFLNELFAISLLGHVVGAFA